MQEGEGPENGVENTLPACLIDLPVCLMMVSRQ
jgi:hypothetical protein